MIKKIISMCLCLVLVLSAVPFAVNGAEDDGALVSGDFEYIVYYDTAVIKSYKGTAKDVVIPQTLDGYNVTTIGDNSFAGNTFIEKVTIPQGVDTIRFEAFSGCTSLSEVNLPDGITSIESGAFEYCALLADIDLPESLISISQNVLIGTAISNNSDNWDDGVLYIDNCLMFITKKIAGEFRVKDGTRIIAQYVFRGQSLLEKVFIPETVKAIGETAFCDCTSLEDITLPSSGVTINGYAFHNTAYYNNPSNWDNGVLYIGNCLYKADESLTGDYEITKGTTYIADYAFSCTKIESIEIPAGVTKITDSMFYNCTSLNKVSIPEGITSIGSQAFRQCMRLSDIKFPESLQKIGKLAFYQTGIRKINLPKSVSSIGRDAFTECYDLESITVDSDNEIYKSSGNCLIETKSKTIITGCQNSVIPADGSVTVIGDSAFVCCHYLRSVIIPAAITRIAQGSFSYCSNLGSITVDENNENYHSAGNCLIEKESKTLIAGCSGSVIPDDGSVTSIGKYAFSGRFSLESITIPKGIISIGSCAFEQCSRLEEVILQEGLVSIGNNAFCDCGSLKNIEIPDSVTSVGGYAFQGCYSLKTVKLSNRIKELKQCVFYGCTFLETIDLPDSITSIGNYALARCNSLKNVKIPFGVTEIGEGAFYSDTALESIIIPSSVKSIERIAFEGCNNLTVTGYRGSYAEEYATANGITFNALAANNLGDVNDDEKISILDALDIFKCISGKAPAFTGSKLANSDINMDGKITIIDALCIFKHIAGKVSII